MRGAMLWAVAAVGYLALEAVAAASYHPAYSYARNYISDLALPSGATVHGQVIDSPRAVWLRVAFVGQGVLFFLGALLSVPRRPRRSFAFVAAAGVNAAGNVVIATVHSGTVHVVGAVLAIAGGNVAIALGSTAVEIQNARRVYIRASKALAALGLACLAVLAVNSVTGHPGVLAAGVWERGSVYSITSWQLLTGGWLVADRWATRAAARSGSPKRPGSCR